MDYRALFGEIAKWVVEIDDAARIPELVSRAFHVATIGRPGPVVIALPEDMLTERVECAGCRAASARRDAAGRSRNGRAAKSCSTAPSGRWSSSAARAGTRKRWRDMRAFAETWSLPVGRSSAARCCSTICMRTTPATSASASIRSWRRAIKAADLVLLIGGRMGEMPSSDYTLLKSPYPDQALVHVHADAERTRPRLPADIGDQRLAAALRRGLRQAQAGGQAAGRARRGGAC